MRKADVVDVLTDDGLTVELTVALASGDSLSGSEPFLPLCVNDEAGNAVFMRTLAVFGGPELTGTWFWPPRVG